MMTALGEKKRKSLDGASGSRTAKMKRKTSEKKTKIVSEEEQLISGHVDRKQVKKAVNALLAHVKGQQEAKRTSADLLPDEPETVWLQVTTRRVGEERKLKPIAIPLTHSYHQDAGGVCLITKDPQREYKDKLAALNLYPGLISRVVGISKLKGKFKPFEARRQLVQDHSLFLADDRVVNLLPQLCGKVFFQRKKIPVPVNLARAKDLERELSRFIQATYLNLGTGSCSLVKIGNTAMTNAVIIDNLAKAIEGVGEAVPRKWENLQVLHLKTSDSIALPLWNADMTKGIAMDDADRAKLESERVQEERSKRRRLKKAAQEPSALIAAEAALQAKRVNKKASSQMSKKAPTDTADVFDAEETAGLDLSDQVSLK